MSTNNKKYGLILPSATKTQGPKFQASRNVFGDESDSEDDSKKKPVLLRPNQNINRQAKIEQQKALEEDPTVYQYDEIYDSMATQKEEKKSKAKEEKKPKYIENLLKTANKRKIENERRIERQIQKEREKEGDEFADKEVFVTSAYKKKLEEMRLEEEKEKREEYLESIGDVTKQRDLGGFYRHLYEQRLGSDKTDEIKKPDDHLEKHKLSAGSTTPDGPQLDVFKNKQDQSRSSKTHSEKQRNYRKRKSSEAMKQLSDGEIDETDDEINRMNLFDIRDSKRSKQFEENIDADSDFSVNDPSEDESASESEVGNKNTVSKHSEKVILSHKKSEASTKETDSGDKKVKKLEKQEKENTPEPEPPTPKIDIWKKRTVGEVFEQALKRYYERKAARGF